MTLSIQVNAILPNDILENIRGYLHFLEDDNFSLTCRLWHNILPDTLNLELNVSTERCWNWNQGDMIRRIFHRYQEQGKTITALNLTGWNGLVDNDLIPLQTHKVQALSLAGCWKITGHTFTYLQAPSSLTSLNLRDTYLQATSNSSSHLRAEGTMLRLVDINRFSLTHLDISLNYDVADEHLQTICQLPLTFLDVSGGHFITNAGYTFLAKLPLQILKIGGSSRITDKTLSILSSCKSLTDLTIRSNRISDLSLLRCLPLKKIDVNECSNISISQITTCLKYHGIKYSNLNSFIVRELNDLPFFGAGLAQIRMIYTIADYAY